MQSQFKIKYSCGLSIQTLHTNPDETTFVSLLSIVARLVALVSAHQWEQGQRRLPILTSRLPKCWGRIYIISSSKLVLSWGQSFCKPFHIEKQALTKYSWQKTL